MIQATVVPPGEGERLDYGGWEATLKLTADKTGGAIAVLETRHDGGRGASPHVHSLESETFIVIEGTVIFTVGDERTELGPGGVVFGPPRTVHGFEVGAQGARLIHVFTPAGMEDFFRSLHVPSVSRREFVAIRKRHGIESV